MIVHFTIGASIQRQQRKARESNPSDGVQVIVRDYNVDEIEDDLRKDGNGDGYVETVWR